MKFVEKYVVHCISATTNRVVNTYGVFDSILEAIEFCDDMKEITDQNIIRYQTGYMRLRV